MSKLITLDKKLPIKAYNEKDVDVFLDTQFKFFIANLLSLKEDKEDNYNASKKAIKDLFWSMGVSQIKEAFEMYAYGKLNIEPVSNYFDIVLVGKIHSAYKDHLKTLNLKPKKTEEQHKAEQDDFYTICAFDYFIQQRKLPEESVWLYDYLTDKKGLIEFSDKEKTTRYHVKVESHGKEKAKVVAKLSLVEDYFKRLEAKGKHVKDLL